MAARPIRAGDIIREGDISFKAETAVPSEAIENPAEVVGKQALVNIAAGSPIRRPLFPDASLLSQALRENERAIAVKVDELIGVGGFLQPGDRVDVIVYLRNDNAQHVKDSQAIFILHAVRVLAYGEDLPAAVDEAAAGKEAATSKTEKGSEAAKNRRASRTAVVAVKTEEATRLALAENIGILRLALRPAGAVEQGQEKPLPGILSDIALPGKEANAAEKPKGPVVKLYHGLQSEPVQFP